MKKSLIFLLLITILFYSCNNDDDITIIEEESSNFQMEELDNLLLEIQEKLPQFVEKSGRIGSKLSRINYMSTGNPDVPGETGSYFGAFNSSNPLSNTIWSIAYQDMLPKIIEVQGIAEEEEVYNHLGVVNVIEAYVLLTLVDIYGDVPFSEIGAAEPSLDNAAFVYESSLQLLNNAINAFDQGGVNLENDVYYNNDFSKWIKLANSLKMKIYLNTRLVDADAINNFNTIVNSGNFMNNINDDFEYRYGIGITNENQEHPSYSLDYSIYGATTYRSNWLMDKLLNANDPRIRYYFYRQNDCTPGGLGINGEICEEIPETLFCSEDSQPVHYTGDMVFCSVNEGYWGRDHGFGGGIPPETFRRTTTGIYPAAGVFDDNRFLGVNESGDGGLGMGITPILLASWVDFMQAEMALAENNTGTANSFMELGMQKSIEKVMSFITLDPDADLDFAPSSIDVANYISSISEDFNNATINNKWDILAVQQFIAHYGNGIGSYNMYRRTGYPSTLQFHINPNPGAFVRSLLYPDVALEGNTNMEQKPNGEVQVFWDNNPSYPSFPYSN